MSYGTRFAAFGAADEPVSCPWPWETPVCPPQCYCEFYGAYYEDDEVYVLRLDVVNVAAIDTTSKALLFARALGESFLSVNPCDVRGVAFDKVGPGHWTVEIVYSTDDSGTPIAQRSDKDLGDKINENVKLRDEFPGFSVVNSRRLRLIAPAAVSYWLASPIVWSATHGSTNAYDRGEGVWKGSAAQRTVQLQPKEPVPVGPPGGNGVAVAGMSPGTVAGIALAGALLFFVLKGRRKAASR